MITAEAPAGTVRMWPRTARSVGQARRSLTAQLDVWGLDQLADTAELVVSELLTNAVRHAHGSGEWLVGTRYGCVDGGVRIEVHDADGAWPVLREPWVDAECGRGLALADALTRGRWGVQERGGVGKLVWAVVTVAGDGDGCVRPGKEVSG